MYPKFGKINWIINGPDHCSNISNIPILNRKENKREIRE
jgi:hypothetical protein